MKRKKEIVYSNKISEFSIIVFLIITLAACNNSDESSPETQSADSLTSDLMASNKSSDKRDKDDDDDDDTRISNSSDYKLLIKESKWDAEENKLKIEGRSKSKQLVSIIDADSLVFIASTTSDREGEWEVKIKNLAVPPCRIRVEADNSFAESAVKKAPQNCGIGGGDIPTPDPSPSPDPDPTPTPNPSPVSGNVQVFGFNDLGMHCMDEDYSVFSVLPPFNVLHAQVIQKGSRSQRPQILGPSQVDVQYSATADPTGSINSTSIGKTNFWDYVQELFGMSPEPDAGLLGVKMPSEQNGVQSFPEYNSNQQWFSADGIPITPFDDAGVYNPYPLFKVSAIDKSSGSLLSSLDVTLPVSTEMSCFNCHYTGNEAADDATASKYSSSNIVWSDNENPVIQYKENILFLHDGKHNTNLAGGTPVLCADCHYSPALDLAGVGPQGQQIGKTLMSHAVHGRHGMNVAGEMPDTSNPAIISDAGKEACYNCHPGKQTQCFRGAMFTAGLNCQNCHGGLLAVAGKFPLADGSTRQPWLDLPKCQSCHTGDAIDHIGDSIILSSAFQDGDDSAQAIVASNKRFAEQDNTLYRNSRGHGGVSCEACHGSTHAIWPVADSSTNDNLTAIQLQGHAGFISECSVCHETGSLSLTINGPHGMHNVNDRRWNEDHESFYERNPQECKACHGADLKGTVLSRVSTNRVFESDDRQADGTHNIALSKGTEVGCDLCHEMP